MGIWIGLAYGFVEATEFSVLGWIPGALTWRTGNASPVFWVAPFLYGAAGAVVGIVVAILAVMIPGVDWLPVLVFIEVTAGAYLGAQLQGEIFSRWSSAILGLGLGAQLTRVFARHRDTYVPMIQRSMPFLGALVVLIGLAQPIVATTLERRAIASLPSGGTRPNIILLVADTLRASHVSSYGYQRPTTPNIDRLAREGALFLNAYSDSSWTLPSHASLMTGRRVNEHLAGTHRHAYLDHRFPTLAEILGQSGYASGGFVGNIFWVGRHSGLDRGFIHYEDFYGSAADAATRTTLGRMIGYDVLPHAGFNDIPGRKSAGDINQRILRWIDTVRGHPVFVFANYLDVHRPNIPPPSHAGRFGGTPLDPAIEEIALGGGADETLPPGRPALQSQIDRYDEALSYLDEEIGHLVNGLAVRHLLEHTIIVLTSDHGEGFGEHNLVGHGHSLYRDQIHIPLVVSYPAHMRPGTRYSQPVTLDELPRLLIELSGVPGSPFPGRSVRAARESDAVVSEVDKRLGFPRTWPAAAGALRSLITREWQLIVPDTAPVELYHLTTDAGQLHNVAGNPGDAAILASLRARLASELKGRHTPEPRTTRKASVHKAPL